MARKPKTGYDKLMASRGAPVDGGYGTQSEINGQGGGAGGVSFSTTPGAVALGGFGRPPAKPKFNLAAKSDYLGNVTPKDLGLPMSPNYGKVKGIKNQVGTFHKTRGKVGF